MRGWWREAASLARKSGARRVRVSYQLRCVTRVRVVAIPWFSAGLTAQRWHPHCPPGPGGVVACSPRPRSAGGAGGQAGRRAGSPRGGGRRGTARRAKLGAPGAGQRGTAASAPCLIAARPRMSVPAPYMHTLPPPTASGRVGVGVGARGRSETHCAFLFACARMQKASCAQPAAPAEHGALLDLPEPRRQHPRAARPRLSRRALLLHLDRMGNGPSKLAVTLAEKYYRMPKIRLQIDGDKISGIGYDA